MENKKQTDQTTPTTYTPIKEEMWKSLIKDYLKNVEAEIQSNNEQ